MRLSFSWPADEICRPLPTARGSASEKRLQAASPDKEFEITETGEEDGEEEEEGGGGGKRKQQRVRASYFFVGSEATLGTRGGSKRSPSVLHCDGVLALRGCGFWQGFVCIILYI